MTLIRIERTEPRIVELIMQDEVGQNALSESFVELLMDALGEVGRDPSHHVCILRGLPDVFCAGGSKDMLRAVASNRVAPADILVPRYVLDVPIPVIAAMEGHAVGGGFTLGLCCDLVLVSQNSRYGLTFMNMGFTPGMGTTRLLHDALGPLIAGEMMFSGQFFRGSHFAGKTALNYVLPKGEVLPKARDIAARIADKPRKSLELLKRSLTLHKRLAFEEARTLETMMHELSFQLPETKQRIEEEY